MKQNIKDSLVLIVAVLGIALSLGSVWGSRNERLALEERYNKNLKAATSEIERIRNEKNQETAKRLSLEGDFRELQAFKTSADPELRRLASIADKFEKNLRAAAALSVVSRIPEIEAPAEITINGKAPEPGAPEIRIEAAFADTTGAKWVTGCGIAEYKNGSAKIRIEELQVKNDFNIAFAKEDFGFLKLKRRSIVEVTALNPYSTTQNIQALQAPEPKPNRAAWIGAGAAGAVLVKIAADLIRDRKN